MQSMNNSPASRRNHRNGNGTILKVVLIILLTLSLAVCWKIGRKLENSSRHTDNPLTDAEFEVDFPYLVPTELDTRTEPTDEKVIDLSKCKTVFEITEGGDYRLTGELEGTLHIRAVEQNVHIILDNAVIRSTTGPAIYCEKADKLVITSLGGTENTISDQGKYRAGDDVEACIYGKCDITLNGSGKLTINGLYKDALRSNDIIKIFDGTYEIKCKRTGIHATDGVYIHGGNTEIYSEKNGIKTTKTGDEGRGNIVIGGGNMSIIAGRYSFVSEKSGLYVYNCHILSRSVIDTYQVAGVANIAKGCLEQ